jgi:hypothetical protein
LAAILKPTIDPIIVCVVEIGNAK